MRHLGDVENLLLRTRVGDSTGLGIALGYCKEARFLEFRMPLVHRRALKPDSALYRFALHALGVSETDAVVIEDNLAGVQSAYLYLLALPCINICIQMHKSCMDWLIHLRLYGSRSKDDQVNFQINRTKVLTLVCIRSTKKA